MGETDGEPTDAGRDPGDPPTDADVDDVDAETVDAETVDAEVADAEAGDADRAQQCGEHQAKIEAFVAGHRGCSSDDDCVIVGHCGASNFQSVAREFADAATALVVDGICQSNDGPTYNTFCRAGVCEKVQSALWCGAAPQSGCPAGMQRRELGCGESDAKFQAGCYAACAAVGDDSACAPGYKCQRTSVNPCPVSPGQGGGCAACGMETTLCLPAPACELELALGFDGGRSQVEVHNSLSYPAQSTQLELWLYNRTDRSLTLSFDVPCHGPRVTGLADYDLWNGCLAGACQTDTVRTELTLAPREKLRWRRALVATVATTCNATGLALGSYAPSFALSGLQGAVTCGPAPATLLVSKSP